MIKTAQDAYLAGRQAALEKIAMSREDKMGYGVNAGLYGTLFGLMGAAGDSIGSDIDGVNRLKRTPPGRLGSLKGLIGRNRGALALGAIGAGLGALSYMSRKHKNK